MNSFPHILRRCLDHLLILALLLASSALASTPRSELSRWLAEHPVADLQQQLAEHPRFAGQQVTLARANDNALTEAIYTVLQANLQQLVTSADATTGTASAPAGKPMSVDALTCNREHPDYRLLVSVTATAGNRATASVKLIDSYSGTPVEQWRWQGRLTRGERDYLEQLAQQPFAAGRLDAPWLENQVAEAAAALSRDFVCSLRPWLADQARLEWTGSGQAADKGVLPATLSDTLRTSQHYIAAYDELALSSADPQYLIETRAVPLSDGVWQLWINASPTVAGLPGVEAATYLLAKPSPASQVQRTTGLHPVPEPQPVGRDALGVEVLGITRLTGWRHADLALRLRLHNRSQRALEYGLKTSGGYFAGCRGTRASYHHDRWGATAGALAPGESRVATIRVERVPHRPEARNGGSACAGFADLGAFSDYVGQGDRVTQYLRWQD